MLKNDLIDRIDTKFNSSDSKIDTNFHALHSKIGTKFNFVTAMLFVILIPGLVRRLNLYFLNEFS